MKHVLMIAYYFPPLGGSGVQRPLKFAKYLPEFGWQPHVLTPEPGSYRSFDSSLETELTSSDIHVLRVGANTPFHKVGKLTQILSRQSELVQQWLRWITSWYMIPDNKKGWIRPAGERAAQFLEANHVDAIYATAPPMSNFLIAQELKQKTGLPLILDYRDDPVDGHLMTSPTRFHRNRLAGLEQGVLQHTDVVTAINEPMLNSIRKRCRNLSHLQFEIVEQGYDPQDFAEASNGKKWSDDQLHFLYSGIFYDSNQPDPFLKALRSAINSDPEMAGRVKMHFQGHLTERHYKRIKELGLEQNLLDHGYVTHKQAVENLKKADVLWLIANFRHQTRQITTGKLFEYVGAAKPVIGLVDTEGEAAKLLRMYHAAYISNPSKHQRIVQILMEVFKCWKQNSWPQPDKQMITNFNRKMLTGKLAKLLDQSLD